MRRRLLRILAGAVGIFLALSLGRVAAGLRQETARREALEQQLAQVEAQHRQLRQARRMTREELRRWALERGWVCPEDTVFFDGGPGGGDAEPSQK